MTVPINILKVAIIPHGGGAFVVDREPDGKINVVDGYEAGLLKMFLQGMKMNYSLHCPADDEWGKQSADGNWSGMVGMIQRGEVHVALPMAITEERTSVVDYSFPYTIKEITFATKIPSLLPKHSTFVMLFDMYIWLALLVVLVVLPISFQKIIFKSSTYIKNAFVVLSILLRQSITIGVLCDRSRILLLVWILSAMFISSIYNSILLSFLSIPLREASVSNAKQLSEALKSGTYACATVKGSMLSHRLLVNKDKSIRAIGEYIVKNNWYFDPTKEDASKFLFGENNRAIIWTKMSIKMMFQDSVFISREVLFSAQIAVATVKKFRYRKRLNKIIHKIIASGIVEKGVEDFAFREKLASETALDSAGEDNPKQIEVKDLYAAFFLLILGYLLAVVTCILEIILIFSEVEAADDCVPGFKSYTYKSSDDAELATCARVFAEELSWDGASAACKINFSYLTERIYFNSSLHLELVKKGIDIVWVGIRRRAHFFIRQSSSLFEEKENVWGSHWSPGEPRRSDCVALNSTDGSLLTYDCRTPLSYVCESNETFSVHRASGPYTDCPEDWFISYRLAYSGRKCESKVNKAQAHGDAEEVCKKNSGRLATFEEYEVLCSNNYFCPIIDDTAWVNKEDYEACPFKVMHPGKGSADKRPRNCSTPLQFICVKDLEIKSKDVDVVIRKGGTSNDEAFSGTAACQQKLILTCDVDVKDDNLKQRLLYRWYKDNVPIPSATSYTCWIGGVEGTLKWDRYTFAEESRQGSYHCEVSFAGLTRTYSSSRVDVFFSDVATYIIDVGGIDINSFQDYSRHGFTKTMKDLNSIIMTLLERENFKHPAALWDLKSISVAGRIATMKILVYIHRTSILNFDDEKVYRRMKHLFEGNALDFTYKGKIYVRVYSADVCFGGDVKLSDTCGNKLQWPTAGQSKNVISKNAVCLSEEKIPLYKECKGSLVHMAHWNVFNCSSCSEFHERFQDAPFTCPDGYTKFKNTNMCIKIFYEPKSWTEAYKTCAESSSYLLSELSEDIELDEVWISYKYSYGKVQNVGMKWGDIKISNVVVESPDSECISEMSIKKGPKFKFKKCSDQLSFVCIRNPLALESSVKFAHTWTRLPSRDSCYYFDKTLSYSWDESVKTCSQTFHSAHLLRGIQDADTYKHLKKIIYQEFDEPSCEPKTWWMNFTHDQGLISNVKYIDWSPYTNFDLQNPYGSITLYPDRTIHWTLDNPDSYLKLACEIQKCEDNRPTQAYIEDRSEFSESINSNMPFRDYSKYLEAFKLKCIPSGWFIRNSIHWYKDGVLLDIVSDELDFSRPSVIIGNPVMTEMNALKFQGYYSCSVDQLLPKLHRVHSSSYLFKMPGIHTFVQSVKLRNKAYVNDCSKYVFEQNTYEDHFTDCYKNNFNHISSDAYILLRNVTCLGTHVDALLHIHFKVETGSEQELLRQIQDTDFFHPCTKEYDIDASISVRSTVACYREKSNLNNYEVTWPTTPIGKTAYPEEMCLTSEGKLLERKCLGDFNSGAVWSSIPIDECSNIESNITKELHHLRNEIVSGSLESLGNLPNLTTSSENFMAADVQFIAQIFENLADESSLAPENLNIVVETMSNLIDAKPEIIKEAENSSNQIIEYFERISSVVEVEDEGIDITTKNVMVDIYSMDPSSQAIPNCIEWHLLDGSKKAIFNASAKDLQDKKKTLDNGVVLPMSFITKNSNTSDRLMYAVSKNLNHVKNMKAVSSIIHVFMPNASANDLGKEEVTLFFRFNEKIDVTANSTPKCVFWDTSLNTWSFKGCFPREINGNSVLCVCNHLTSFSVIMEIDSTPISSHHKNILHFITYIGCSLSCIGFCLLIITFTCFREWRKSVKNKALFNYSVSQFIFLFVFMVSIDQTSSKAVCKVAAILLHYFLLSSFAWMVVLAFTVYLSLVKVLDTYIPCLIQKFMVFAWGIPAVILIVMLSLNHEYYSRDDYCWLSKDVLIYGIIIPLALMLAVNFVIFGSIFHVNMCRRPYLRINQDRRKLVIARAKALFCTSILLGLSWIFGFMAIGEAKLTFQYLFSITTPLQGFLLAIFFVIRPKSTRDLWLRFFCPGYSHKSSPSHTINSIIISQRVDNGRSTKYENMINSVMYRAHSPFTPYT